jgi:hypothetical protein
LKEPLVFTEVENALLLMSFEPTQEWDEETPARGPDPVVEEREANRRAALRVLDIFYDIDQQFKHIELGLID